MVFRVGYYHVTIKKLKYIYKKENQYMKRFLFRVNLFPNVLIWPPKYAFQKIMQGIPRIFKVLLLMPFLVEKDVFSLVTEKSSFKNIMKILDAFRNFLL